MKRVLQSPTPIWESGKRHAKMWMALCAFLLLGSAQAAAQTVSTSECQCQSGTADYTNGLVQDVIVIMDVPGLSYAVLSIEGLYDPTSTADNLIDFALGATFEENPLGTYTLTGLRQVGEPFTVETINNNGQGPTVTSFHICDYPSTEIMGDMGTCEGSSVSYSVDPRIENPIWSVTGGNILSGQGTSTIMVEWPNITRGVLDVSGEIYGHPDDVGLACNIMLSDTVDVLSSEATVIACNNSLNLSMNGNCELDITPSLLLEDMMYTDDSYELEVRDIEADTFISDMTLTGQYIGKMIEVKVIQECSRNSCWGLLRVEDKSMPELMCPPNDTIDCDELSDPLSIGLPLPDGSDVTQIDDNTFFVDGFDQCGGVTISYYDEVNANLCDGPFSREIKRSWYGVDGSGNTDTCSSFIYIRRADFGDLQFPPSYDEILGTEPSIQACSGYPETEEGFPHPDLTGRPTGTFCMNVEVDYEDWKVEGCSDESYKIQRKWTVSDLCGTSNMGDTTFTQWINVIDNEAPICNTAPPFEAGTSALSCEATFDVPAPIVDDCSPWSYTVGYKEWDLLADPYTELITDGIVQRADGSYTVTADFTANTRLYLSYTILDDCGNWTNCHTEVTIVDNEEPIPVCDQYTFVALNEDGVGYATPPSIDDGSLDNCELDHMEIRRMDANCGEDTEWKEKLQFCCDDVGEEVMVALRVWDAAGNSNQCMVEVEVQDNIPPRITYCPEDITVDCRADVSFLAQFGTIEAEDICGFTISESEDRSNARCGNGEIIRTFTATDVFGNTSSCRQVITIENNDPFYINPLNPNDSKDDVTWPRDYTANTGCIDADLSPDALPAANGRPQLADAPCSEVSVTHEDIVFQYVDGACYKILRTWTVIDFCQYNPFLPDAGGKWDYTQVLKVNNNTRPTIDSGCSADDIEITQRDGCRADIRLTANGSDDCTPADLLKWSYKIDIGDNGTIDYSGEGNIINREVEFMTMRVIWEVEDQCGNTESCEGVFTIADDKAPSPYCLPEIVTVLMETNGTVEIKAEDFDRGSTDNCSDVVISFSSDVNNTTMQFSCDDIEGDRDTVAVEIWVTDESGNQDFCTARLTLQDNHNVCPDDNNNGNGNNGNTGNRVAISGSIYTEEQKMVENVTLQMSANDPEFPVLEYTDTDGKYAFQDLAMFTNYSIAPELEGAADEGVSTLDLVMIQRHILGLTPLDSPYKLIAADINNSESVSGSDVVALRKIILGIDTEFRTNESWRFVDAAYQFADPTFPWPFSEELQYENIANDMTGADFVAVKIGDVNNSINISNAQDNNTENRSAYEVEITNSKQKGGHVTVPVYAKQATAMLGMQFTLSYDAGMTLEAVQSDVLSIGSNNIASGAVAGQALVSWNEALPVQVAEGDLLMELHFSTTEAIDLNAIHISEDLIDAEVYSLKGGLIQTEQIVAQRSGEGIVDGAFKLYQNTPNPFNTSTNIAFELPEAGQATLKVFDINGRLIKQLTDNYAKGYNTVQLDINDLDATGILYYQLDSDTHSASKKMVVIR